MADPTRSPDHQFDWRADVRARIAGVDLDPEDERALIEEIAQHLEAQFEDLVPSIGVREARERLLAQLRDDRFEQLPGSVRRTHRPRARGAVWGAGSIWRDVRYGVRALRRSPGVFAAGLTALALGIGLTTVMFSIVYGLVIKGLPFENPDRIAIIYRPDPRGRGEESLMPYGDIARYRAEQRSFGVLGAYSLDAANVSGGGRPERLQAARVTAGALEVAGVRPLLGRTFTASDDAHGAPPTAVIGYAMWRDRFASDSGVIDKLLRVDATPYTIIGVMPERYQFPNSESLWLPLRLDAGALGPGEGPALNVVGRLRPNATYASANAELTGFVAQLKREYADTASTRSFAQPFIRGVLPSRVSALLYSMLGAVFLVLLVACANVANLLLDRAVNRTREIGIRVALGASRAAVIRESLVESAVLALLAGVVGAGLAQAGVVAFNRATASVGEAAPFWMDVRLHPAVLVFVLAVAIVASLVSGLLPAIHSARLDVSTILKDESQATSSRRAGRISRGIVVLEIALSSAMLLVAGFMTKSIVQARTIDPRFEMAGVLTARLTLTSHDTVARARVFSTLERELSATPGISAASFSNDLPGAGWSGAQLSVEGRTYARPRDRAIARWLAVTPVFFDVFAVRMLRGRAILATDDARTQRVAVISDELARRQFPGVDPIGRRILVGNPASDAWLTIVGVMPTLYAASATSANGNHYPPEVLTAFWQRARTATASLALRVSADADGATAVRKAMASLDPDAPVYDVTPMREVLARQLWPVRVFGTLFVVFGAVALVLAAIGLYAVMAFSVSRRVREMGIRLALGATSGDVVRLVCRQGAVQVLLGMTVGLFIGSGAVRAARAVLFEVQPGDSSVVALVVSVLGAAALVACLVPAIRATRVDPVIALRSE